VASRPWPRANPNIPTLGSFQDEQRTHCPENEIRAGLVTSALTFTYLKPQCSLSFFPHAHYVFIIAHTLCITTIWGWHWTAEVIVCPVYFTASWFCAGAVRDHVPALSSLSAELLSPLLLGACNSATFFQYIPQYKISPDFIYRTDK